MILIGIALALFFIVEWMLTFAVVFQTPIVNAPTWLLHIAYWIMIILAVVGGIMAQRKK